jgi:hypothetical protein
MGRQLRRAWVKRFFLKMENSGKKSAENVELILVMKFPIIKKDLQIFFARPFLFGSPYGNRTHVAGMKILCPNH